MALGEFRADIAGVFAVSAVEQEAVSVALRPRQHLRLSHRELTYAGPVCLSTSVNDA